MGEVKGLFPFIMTYFDCDSYSQHWKRHLQSKQSFSKAAVETLTGKENKGTFTITSIRVACFTFVLSKVIHFDVCYNPCLIESFVARVDMSPRNVWCRSPRYITVQSDSFTFFHSSDVPQGLNRWRNCHKKYRIAWFIMCALLLLLCYCKLKWTITKIDT